MPIAICTISSEWGWYNGVVAQQRFIRDDLAQRQDLALIVAGDVIGGAVGAIGVARLRAHVDRQFEQAIDALHIGRFRLAHANLTKIEQRNLQLNVEAAQTNAFIGSLFQLVGVVAWVRP
jgi:hypothetical protein